MALEMAGENSAYRDGDVENGTFVPVGVLSRWLAG